VANAIGPYVGIVQVYMLGMGGAAKKSDLPDWILAMGGAGLVVGLGLFGQIIIAAMGVNVVKITPTVGFCVELSTAFVIVLGSYLGLGIAYVYAVQAVVCSIVPNGLVSTLIVNPDCTRGCTEVLKPHTRQDVQIEGGCSA
jgi:phosphate/sulfate permease